MKKYISTILGAAPVILELLPYGAVLNMMQPPEEAVNSLKYYYSYFDITPFGYANFGPFLTAVLTSVILVLTVVGIFVKKRRLVNLRIVLCCVALITSLMPLLFGITYFTWLGLCISLLILINGTVTYFLDAKK